MENERRIIYVDAGSINSDNYKISLYDIGNNATHTMELSEIESNTEAEKYAVFHAIYYINKNNFENSMILCDNKSAVEDKIINAISKELYIQVSWIPREINKIADETCKRDSNLKDSDFNTLSLFINLAKKAYVNLDNNEEKLKNEIKKSKEQVDKLKIKVKNQATQITSLKKK